MNHNIIFTIGEEFVPIIETDAERIKQTSLFQDIYVKTFKSINEFLTDSRKTANRQPKEVNNIFAFIGERGAGKSSCMQSVAHILSDRELYARAFGKDEPIYDTNFVKLDAIDPGMFEKNNNILQLVVGKLFKEFKDNAEQQGREDNHLIRKRELIACFDRIYRNIRILSNQTNSENESLDALLDLSASYDLKDNFRRLVDLYLKWHNNGHERNDILVLQIDDIDLQTQYAYDMVEQIRKYMMHPNIIILMAVRLSQLKEVVTRQYVQEFQPLLSSSEGYMDKNAPVEMSERYLGKLIPHDRRLFLPQIEDLFTHPLIIVDSDTDTRTEYPSIRQAVLELIFKKTRFLFYDTKGFTNYIVPRNLRELRSLIRLLYKMPMFWEKDDKGNITDAHPYNQTLFQKYFFETWLQNNLDRSGIELIQNAWNAEVIVKNKLIIDYFYGHYFNQYKEDIPYPTQQILLSSRRAYDISIGDVLGVLDAMEIYLVAPNEQKLIFAIRTTYSLLLDRYYNLYKDKEQKDLKPQEILKNEILEDVPSYLKLVGGAFIDSNSYDLLPPERNGRSRIRKSINIHPLLHAVYDILKNTGNSNKIQDPDKLALLNLLEFTLLNIVARDESRTRKIDTRSISNPSYSFPVSPYTQYFQFDILGFTYNFTQYLQIHARYLQLFGISDNTEKEQWIHYLLEHPASLYSRINTIAKARKSYAAMVCFRNCEVINSFVWHILQNRPLGAKDNLSLYAAFYRRLGRFKIDTYDNYSIEFSFIGQIAEVLSQITEERTPKAYALFNSMFFPQQTLNIDIKLNAGSKNAYNTLLEKLQKKNDGIDEIDSLFARAFPERRSYDSQEAKQQLQFMKQLYENRMDEDNG